MSLLKNLSAQTYFIFVSHDHDPTMTISYLQGRKQPLFYVWSQEGAIIFPDSKNWTGKGLHPWNMGSSSFVILKDITVNIYKWRRWAASASGTATNFLWVLSGLSCLYYFVLQNKQTEEIVTPCYGQQPRVSSTGLVAFSLSANPLFLAEHMVTLRRDCVSLFLLWDVVSAK